MGNLSPVFRDWAHSSNTLGRNRIPEEYDGVCTPRDIYTVHMIDSRDIYTVYMIGSMDINVEGPHTREVPREQNMLKGHLPRVIYNRVYLSLQRAMINSSDRCRGWPSHKRPYVGASHARSWSPLLVLGAILREFIAKN